MSSALAMWSSRISLGGRAVRETVQYRNRVIAKDADSRTRAHIMSFAAWHYFCMFIKQSIPQLSLRHYKRQLSSEEH